MPQLAGPRKAERRDWRTYYDNCRGIADEAIREAARAYGAGLITEAEWAEIDAELRRHQGRLHREPAIPHQMGAGKSRLALGWPRRRPQRSPDREASRQRARMLGGAACMPPAVRAAYTECERAVLFIVAREVKRHGICDLSVGQIAAESGTCVRTVQNAIAWAVRQGHVCREERERRGQPNLTNIVRIMSQEWLTWIKRGPVGCKEFIASKNIDGKKEHRSRFLPSGPRVFRILRVSG